MKFIDTSIKDVLLIKPRLWEDERGYFYESYNQKLFKEAGITANFVQDNESLSHKGTLRGLHAQKNPFAQGKLVRVIQGKVLDVVVDIRKKSPTFGQHVSVVLSAENHHMLWVPPGFLHGFVTLVDNTIFTYKVTNFYDKASEIGVCWNDPDLKINWGIVESELVLSEKDGILPYLKDIDSLF